ncbi:MAG: glycosyltransferase family 9 protein [Caulobacteraceae bacterium]|nr:glycosyltransferase family 9 protein [Caulobacteraceae bacterium]
MASAFPILCILESRPEDAVLSSGLLRKLHQEIPQATFTLVGSDASAPLFRDMPNLDDLLVIEGDGGGERFKLWNRVRNEKWGLVVDLRGTSLSGWLSRRRRAERKPWPKGEPVPHKVIQAAHVLQVQDDPPAPWLYTDGDTEAEVGAFLETQHRAEGPILAVGPGSDWIGKVWQPERFAKVAGALLGPDGPMPDGRLLIVGTEEDREAAHTIRMTVPRERLIEAQGKLDRLQTCALLKRARMYVGNDSIWTHLAVAANVPAVLGVFGPSDETLEGPWGPGRMSVRGPKSMEEFRKHDPRLNQTINHMYDVPVDTVVEAALKLFADTEA